MQNAKQVGNTISTIRKQKGWTQKELAEKLHVSNAAVSKWERGINYPDLTLMEPLANLLEITVPELLGLVDETEQNIIKDITEISKQEKEKLTLTIKKKIILTALTFFSFIIIVVCILLLNRKAEIGENIFRITKSGILEIIALIIGSSSWILAFVSIISKNKKEKNTWKNYSIYSMICCSISLYFPILITDLTVRIGDFSAVRDIAWGFHYASIVLLLGTLFLNALNWYFNIEKEDISYFSKT